MALAYLDNNDLDKAGEFSNVSLLIEPEDRFVRMNHAKILIGKEELTGARKIYDQLIQEERTDDYTWYERAALDQRLGKVRKALRGYLTAMKLEKQIPYPYLEAADLYEFEFEMPEKTEKILLMGIGNTNSPELYVRLGDYYKERQRWISAKETYRRCVELFPEHGYAYIGIAESILNQKNIELSLQYIKDNLNRFNEDSVFLINCGRMIGEAAKEEKNYSLMEEGLTLLENGLKFAQSNVNGALEIYINLVEETHLVDRGIAYLKQRAEEVPSVIEYKCYLGVLYEHKKQYVFALDCYNAALQIREDSFPYYRLGEVYFTMGQFKLAEGTYKKCIQLDPYVDLAYLKLAEISSKKNNQQQEAEYLLALLDIDPMSVETDYLSTLLDPSGLQKLLNKLKTMEDKEAPSSWRLNTQAYIYGALGDIQEEQRLLNTALEIEPEAPALLHHQALLFLKTRELEKCLHLLEVLLNEFPEDEDLYRMLIECLVITKRWTKLPYFLHQLNVTNELKPKIFVLAAETLAEHFCEVNWPAEVKGNLFNRISSKLKNRTSLSIFHTIIGLFENAVKIDMANLYPIYRLAKFYEKASLTDDAIKVLKKELTNKWDNQIVYQLVLIYINTKDYPAAFPLLEKFSNLHPEDTYLQTLTAYVIAEMGDKKEAEQRLWRIIEVNPFEKKVHFRLGRILIDQGNYSEAKGILEKGLDYHPFDTSIKYNLAIAYSYLNEYKRAFEINNEILKVYPSNLNALYNKPCFLSLLNRLDEAKEILEYVFEKDPKKNYYREMAKDEEQLANLRNHPVLK